MADSFRSAVPLPSSLDVVAVRRALLDLVDVHAQESNARKGLGLRQGPNSRGLKGAADRLGVNFMTLKRFLTADVRLSTVVRVHDALVAASLL